MPKISVVTSVYNCERFVGETIQSVINQTFTDWEYILIDDCSKDRSADIIQSFADKDSRIRLIRNEHNQGQCRNLNHGIQLAKGEYIARLDHDDLCYPERFQKQLDYMEAHKETVLCGCRMDMWQDGIVKPGENYPIFTPEEIRFSLMFGVFVIAHSSFFIRKSAMTENDIWYRKYLYAEDYDMQIRFLKVGNVASLPETLITYRVFPENCTHTYSDELKNSETIEIRKNYIQSLPLKGKEFLLKGLLHELKTRAELEGFTDAFSEYASYCGIEKWRGSCDSKKCLRLLFMYAYRFQPKSLALFVSYLKSPFRNLMWLLSLDGMSFTKRCILRRNKPVKLLEE